MKVKHLIMKTFLHPLEFEGIAFMLKSCPNLEHLTIEIVEKKYMNHGKKGFYVEPVFITS
ncbi:F-box protein [Medicago truncatula]|uniref:F-box protein n=1 Tax=Medicago truncatula TaxID=3880 RepID=G7KBT1_MEDTR|nr:F-box protein [Medicago truncatula]